MSTVTQHRVIPRPAHPKGPTFLTYTPNGKKLITAGTNNVVRVYETGSVAEPTNLDDCQENNTAVAATNDFFLAGSEDGAVCMYSLETYTYEKLIARATLSVRDIAISPDGQWAAIASDDMTVKVVNTEDTIKIMYLRGMPKPVKHLTFDPSGTYIAASCTDGIIYIYSLSKEEPELIRKINDVIRSLDAESNISSMAAWHPDGRAFAAPTSTREIQVVSYGDGERQRMFSGGHVGNVTSLAWSPNGAFLLTAGSDGKMLLWDTGTQKPIATYDFASVINIAWHSHENIVSFVTAEGELYIHENFLRPEHASLLDKTLQPAPFIRDPLAETNGNARKLTNGVKLPDQRRRRQATPDSLDSILGPADDEDDFVSDDDGAGYADEGGYTNGLKRSAHHLDAAGPSSKRRNTSFQPSIHPSFQPGSTAYRGSRAYLTINQVGVIWTVDQDTHSTVTVEFTDRDLARDFHFTDPYGYDKACLSTSGCLFSHPPSTDYPTSTLFYRPHSTWTPGRTDFRTPLPQGEEITSIALSNTFIIATTSTGYVRIYTLYGTPHSIFRLKSSPIVTSTAHNSTAFLISNGPLSSLGEPTLTYTLTNLSNSTTYQNCDLLPLPPSTTLVSAFFTDEGDPCIYDSAGVLLIAQHWRTLGQARWTPILDTKQLSRLQSGRKTESYWPVAVAGGTFHCIILKGGEVMPPFPRPLVTEFELQIPVVANKTATTADGNSNGEASLTSQSHLEENFVRSRLLASLLSDRMDATKTGRHQLQSELLRKELEADKILLQLLNLECQAGEERGMKALALVELLRDGNGKMVEAAGKVADRYGLGGLGEKIREEGERRLEGDEGEDL